MPASEAAYAEARAARRALHDFLAAQTDDHVCAHWARIVGRAIERGDVEPRMPPWFGGMGALDDLVFVGAGEAARNLALGHVLGRYAVAMRQLILGPGRPLTPSAFARAEDHRAVRRLASAARGV